ncbi:MAG TPA: molybdopterin-guanine dinucleotide biosynthesis protein B [Gemmatimonadales bacterium]|nr:molybdopterin-guanine dinucleotide biosynthesis protein B [Gemmatimonadales bacterium]
MAATRLISIVGKKNAGKTTLVVALVAELVRRKFRVMTLKHGTHAANLDHEGKDTWRHFHEGKAERVLLEAPGERVLFERTRAESDPVALARRYLDGADIVVCEGFSAAPIPKIEVFRLACGDAPLWAGPPDDPGDWVAMVTDHPGFHAPFPVFRFTDTAWLVSLANMAWDRARILAP